ncbi:MAG TPA: SH3 domain-containing protein [Anaerolineaceae bacterium]|nr:SH3 domain-containing protein [Anaerolineaceae bacterium]
MMIKRILLILPVVIAVVLVFLVNNTVNADFRFQQPTISIPTVTGTPQGAMVYVDLFQEDPVNVRSGPGVFYDEIGILLPGESAPALGRSAGGDWILISYVGVESGTGWVYSPLVTLSGGELSIVEPPPSPTPETTATIDATLAAQFLTTPAATNLPTYTAAPPQTMPNYVDEVSSGISQHIPIGLIILIIGGLGVLIAVISFITER